MTEGKPKKLSEEAENLLSLIPLDGTFAGNTSLMRRSGLGAQYWKVRKELERNGDVTLGKGRGGSVARSQNAQAAPPPTPGGVAEEVDLYEPLRKWLLETWGREVTDAGDFFEVKITATARARTRSSGQWSRPDLTLVEVDSFEYLPVPVLAVTTLEVKKFSEAQNIVSVYEAAAHARWAHNVYLVAEIINKDYKFPDRFIDELERFGVGLMVMWKNDSKWEVTEILDPTQETPGENELEQLLREFFKDDDKRLKQFKKAIGK